MVDGYHHGDLRSELLKLAVAAIQREGPADLSLRALSREAGVSHTAHRNHFATRNGLLSALAAEGFRLLTTRLIAAGGDGFLEVGVAYVGFAVDFPAHFEVMFRPDLLDTDNAELVAAQQETFGILRAGVDAMASDGKVADAAAAVIAGWSLVHGLATLAAGGNLETAHLRELLPDLDLLGLTRRAAGMLYGSPDRSTP